MISAPILRTKTVQEHNSDIVSLACKLMHDTCNPVTLRQLATQAELLAMRLEAIEQQRKAPLPLTLAHGNYCRSYRQRYKLTIRDVADFALISRHTIVDVELGRKNPSQATMLSMSYGLKVPASKLWPALNAVPVSAEVIG